MQTDLKNTISIPVWEMVDNKFAISSYNSFDVTYLIAPGGLRIVVNGYLTKQSIEFKYHRYFRFKESILMAISEYVHRDMSQEYPVIEKAATLEQVSSSWLPYISNNLLPIKKEDNRDRLTKYGLTGMAPTVPLVKTTPQEPPHSKSHHSRSGNKIQRVKEYPLELILNFIKSNPTAGYYIDEDGNKCKLRRASVFASKGVICEYCKAEGKFFALEKWPDGTFHFDLYGTDNNGHEVLMTVDHITAKARGGRDHISNFQTLCKVCNEAKGDSVENK